MVDLDSFTCQVIWSDKDQELVGLCNDFPSLSKLAKDQDSALQVIYKVVSETMDDLIGNQKTSPKYT
jgi:hypothetical protein